jgi:hypothetical protein
MPASTPWLNLFGMLFARAFGNCMPDMHIGMSANRNRLEPAVTIPTLRRPLTRLLLASAALLLLGGCEAIGTIFEAGVWVGIIVVLGIVAIVAVIASLFRR